MDTINRSVKKYNYYIYRKNRCHVGHVHYRKKLSTRFFLFSYFQYKCARAKSYTSKAKKGGENGKTGHWTDHFVPSKNTERQTCASVENKFFFDIKNTARISIYWSVSCIHTAPQKSRPISPFRSFWVPLPPKLSLYHIRRQQEFFFWQKEDVVCLSEKILEKNALPMNFSNAAFIKNKDHIFTANYSFWETINLSLSRVSKTNKNTNENLVSENRPMTDNNSSQPAVTYTQQSSCFLKYNFLTESISNFFSYSTQQPENLISIEKIFLHE